MRKQLTKTALVTFLALSVFLVGVGTVGAVSDTDVSVTPANATADVGETQTFEVVLEDGDSTQGYELSIAVANGTVGEIVAADTAGNPSLVDDVQISADGTTADVTAAYTDPIDESAPLTVATVTVETAALGTTEIQVENGAEIRDANNQQYNLTGYTAGTVTVREPQSDFAVTNLEVPDSVRKGETAVVTGTVENTGTASGTETVQLAFNGTVLDRTNVTLAGGVSRAFNFSVDTSGVAVGEYTATVSAGGDSEASRLTVADANVVVLDDSWRGTGPSGQRTFDIAVDPGTEGTQGYNLTVELTNATVGTIVDAETAQDPALADDVQISADGSSVAITAAYANPLDRTTAPSGSASSSALRIASVTVAGNATGTTDVAVTGNSEVRTADNDPYVVGAFGSAELRVPILPSRDTDGDGLHEDVDGDGSANVFDAIALYNSRDEQYVQDNPRVYDFDGDGRINVFDAIELYNEVS